MTDAVTPVYDDGELALYEVKLPVQFPIRAPTAEERAALTGNAPPYPQMPWALYDEVEIQVTWTLSNLDTQDHYVEVIVDPWNEFGRYWPGVQLVDAEDEEFMPNLSGIDIPYDLPGVNSGRAARIEGTFTIDDMRELAIDYATVINVIENGPPPDPMSGMDPKVSLVNHAFARESRSNRDPLSQPYIPGVIAALTGMDIGLRTYGAANISLEFVVEIVDKGSGKVAEEGTTAQGLVPEPTTYYTLSY